MTRQKREMFKLTVCCDPAPVSSTPLPLCADAEEKKKCVCVWGTVAGPCVRPPPSFSRRSYKLWSTRILRFPLPTAPPPLSKRGSHKDRLLFWGWRTPPRKMPRSPWTPHIAELHRFYQTLNILMLINGYAVSVFYFPDMHCGNFQNFMQSLTSYDALLWSGSVVHGRILLTSNALYNTWNKFHCCGFVGRW